MTSSEPPNEDDEAGSIEGRCRLELGDFIGVWHYVPGFRALWQYSLFCPIAGVLFPLLSPLPARAWLPVLPWAGAALVAFSFRLFPWRALGVRAARARRSTPGPRRAFGARRDVRFELR